MQAVRRNADAAVAHLEPQSNLPARYSFFQTDVNRHRALLSEFQGIIDEIDENLGASSQGPRRERRERPRRRMTRFPILCQSPWATSIMTVDSMMPCSSNGICSNLELAGLDLREIQDVVHEA